MGIFSLESYERHHQQWKEKIKNMSEEEMYNEWKKILIDVLIEKPDMFDEIVAEVRKRKIEKLRERNNEVRTVSKRRIRTNLPPSNPSV